MKKTIKPFLLFAFLFVLFFSSSVGLMNSGDAPQFFTAEAFLKNGNLNMAAFKSDPHYFVWPDFYEYKGQTLSYRGYLTSFLAIPLHLAAGPLSSLMNTDGFPVPVVTEGFAYELAVVSLFTLFSVLGLAFAWKLVAEVTGSSRIASYTALILGAGTYIWKYSAFYSRHGETVFLLSLFMYCLWSVIRGRSSRLLQAGLAVICVVSFGIDLVLFVSTGAFIAILLVAAVLKKGSVRMSWRAFIPAAVVFILIVVLNLVWYGSFSSIQSLKSFQFDSIPMSKRLGAATSAPVASVLPVVLFSAGRIPEAAFSQFKHLPSVAARFTSLEFAKKYDFWGMFVISPFLLFSFLFPFFKTRKKELVLGLSALFLFSLNVGGNATFYAFWGGNQYDIRYFYPFVILLAVPLGLSVKGVLSLKSLISRTAALVVLAGFSAWGIFMGWLGVINMFSPALTGERRIWMEPLAFPVDALRHPWTEYLGATFMNRGNALLAFFCAFALYNGYLVFTSFSAAHKKRLHTSSRPRAASHPPKKGQ